MIWGSAAGVDAASKSRGTSCLTDIYNLPLVIETQILPKFGSLPSVKYKALLKIIQIQCLIARLAGIRARLLKFLIFGVAQENTCRDRHGIERRETECGLGPKATDSNRALQNQ
jgi:hypothetical protein